MDELFQYVEVRIRALIQEFSQLEAVNDQLKQDQSLLAREKEQLLAKQKSVVEQIENMVLRLKSIEGCYE